MPGDDRKTDLLQKIGEGKFLPSFSPLAVELINLAADEKSSAQDLAWVIEKYPDYVAGEDEYYQSQESLNTDSQKYRLIADFLRPVDLAATEVMAD